MDVFYREGYTDIEMEAGPYLSAIYEMTRDAIRLLDATTFAEAGIGERSDLQRLLREQVEIISPDTLVIAEEFGEWEDVEELNLQSSSWYGNGSGSLEGARGSHHVSVDGVVLNDEQDIFGHKWNGEYWAKYAANHMSWDGGDWNGTSWSGTSWSGTSWSGTSRWSARQATGSRLWNSCGPSSLTLCFSM